MWIVTSNLCVVILLRGEIQMMHVFYCIKCKRYHYTNNQGRAVCCGQPMYHVDIDFTDFVKMDREERKEALRIYSLAE